jgi:hypothetical protein
MVKSENAVEEKPIRMGINEIIRWPRTHGKNLTRIASATDYSNAGSNPATILKLKGTICGKRMKRETR